MRAQQSAQGGKTSLTILIAVVFLASVGCLDGQAANTIYVCEDGSGTKHFTNILESSSCRPFQMSSSASYSTAHVWSGASSSSLPKWRSFSGRSPYDAHIVRYGEQYRIDPNLIKAVIRAESDFNRHAVSRRGAQGLMQLMPETARAMHVSDPFSPEQNIKGGTRYLRSLLNTFDGDLPLTLAAYNAGPTLVKRLRRVPRIPETVRYVKRVLAYYERYGGQSGNEVAEADYRSTIRVGDLSVQ